jgi:translation initiation factor 1A
MPKNKGKGGKNRRRGKNENEQTKRELDLKEEGQEYAQVLKILGNGRIRCHCFDGKERLCNIRGKLRKKVWINTNDIILLGLRDYQDEKADVIQKYNPDEARRLKAQGHIPEHILLDFGEAGKEEDNITFANDDDDDATLREKTEEEDDGPAPQRTYLDLSDMESNTESESESDEDGDDDEDDYENYESYQLDAKKYSAPAKVNNKKEFNIDNI